MTSALSLSGSFEVESAIMDAAHFSDLAAVAGEQLLNEFGGKDTLTLDRAEAAILLYALNHSRELIRGVDKAWRAERDGRAQ